MGILYIFVLIQSLATFCNSFDGTGVDQFTFNAAEVILAMRYLCENGTVNFMHVAKLFMRTYVHPHAYLFGNASWNIRAST